MERGDKREAVIQAALELVGEHGFHGAPMALVAEKAGVAAGTIYRYFDSKDVLIRETYAWLEGQMLASLMAQYPVESPLRERFLHVGQKLVNYFINSPMEFRFVEQFFNSPYGVACRREKLLVRKDQDICAELFEEGRRQQIIKDLPLPILFALAFGPLVDVCRDHILQFIELDEATIARTVEACWDALKC